METLPTQQYASSRDDGGLSMMPDERMLQGVLPSTMHMTLDSVTGPLHALMMPKRHSSVPKHPCIQRG